MSPDDVEVAYSGRDLAEVVVAGTDKATALGRLAARLGIDPVDAVVFGDGINDLGMFRWAGRSYGVANADPTVSARATHIAGHHHPDGVAEGIESWFA